MKGSYVVFLAGWLTLSVALPALTTAECGPPAEEEMATRRAAIFAEADADKNQSLSLSEFATFTKLLEAMRAERHFTCLDANNDGQVSAEELAAHRSPHGHHHHRRAF